MTDIQDYPETTAGPANDETTVVPPVTVAAHELAWSVDTEVIELQPRSWASVWGQATVLLVLAVAVAVVIGILGWMVIDQDSPATPVVVPVPSTMPASALPPISTEPVPTGPVDIHDLGPAAVPGTPIPAPTSTVTVQAAPTYTFSGRYTETDTAPTGQSVTNAWTVTSCGDGCVDIAEDGGRDFDRRAQLINGQWVFGVPMMAICSDGSSVPRAGNGHFTIDASTLRGILQDSWTKEACGNPAGDTVTHRIALTREDE
jgi:hypothetical protein